MLTGAGAAGRGRGLRHKLHSLLSSKIGTILPLAHIASRYWQAGRLSLLHHSNRIAIPFIIHEVTFNVVLMPELCLHDSHGLTCDERIWVSQVIGKNSELGIHPLWSKWAPHKLWTGLISQQSISIFFLICLWNKLIDWYNSKIEWKIKRNFCGRAKQAQHYQCTQSLITVRGKWACDNPSRYSRTGARASCCRQSPSPGSSATHCRCSSSAQRTWGTASTWWVRECEFRLFERDLLDACSGHALHVGVPNIEVVDSKFQFEVLGPLEFYPWNWSFVK